MTFMVTEFLIKNKKRFVMTIEYCTYLWVTLGWRQASRQTKGGEPIGSKIFLVVHTYSTGNITNRKQDLLGGAHLQ
jgi:hypothetical protein